MSLKTLFCQPVSPAPVTPCVAEVRKLEKFPTLDWWERVARFFGMLVEEFAAESRLILRGEIPL